MESFQPFILQGGVFGAGLAVGLVVAAVVWRQLVTVTAAQQERSEAIVVALNSIDKTLGFVITLVRDQTGGRKGR